MDYDTETKTIRLTSEILKCIAKSLLVSAEEMERTLLHASSSSNRYEHTTSDDPDPWAL
jgi:hypothetical protein